MGRREADSVAWGDIADIEGGGRHEMVGDNVDGNALASAIVIWAAVRRVRFRSRSWSMETA